MTSQPIPEIPVTDLYERLEAADRRLPFEGVLETTFRCNLRCAHCYVNEDAGDAEIARRELTLERLLRLVDEIADRGALYLLLTGGEVLVRPDFPQVYRRAVERGLLVTIFTNGTLVTERIAELFVELPPHNVEITLYGMSRETYERVTQVPGSYDRCMEGIERLRARGVRFTLKTIALSWNVDEVPAMRAFASGLGLKFRFDSHLNPRVDCGANRRHELQLSPERAVALDLQFPEKAHDLRSFCEAHTRPEPARPAAETLYTCGAGLNTFTIDPYGQLQMCQLSRRSPLSLTEQGFAHAWDTGMPALRARRWERPSVCRTCSLISLCASCPGAAEMETGDAESLVEGFCKVTHLRAWAAMGEGSGHRRDATCCLAEGTVSRRPEAPCAHTARQSSGGPCGHGARPGERLLQLERRSARS